ncbi:MAG: hypothetical protein RBG13Loki_2989 [Promethearchaeota archaeon CR_4]|nr:MAG: hypothetical protein RBG13Loki_2989 [Candidatus Lokiarchaeota archaeon CR_4]
MESIIKVWKEERKFSELTVIPPSIEQIYYKERGKIKEQLLSPAGSIERRVAEKALQRLEFCYHDIFLLRKEKLMVAALQGTDVQIAALLQWEQQYYGDLQRLEFYYKQNIITQHSEKSATQSLPSVLDTPVTLMSAPATFQTHQTEQKSAQVITPVDNPKCIVQQEDAIAFILIRFLRAEEAIIGVDLREYGPFEEGEIANLPDIHARIFITNGAAKQVFPST